MTDPLGPLPSEISRALAALPPPPPPPPFEDVLARIDAARAVRRRPGLAIAAGIVLVLGGASVLALMRDRDSDLRLREHEADRARTAVSVESLSETSVAKPLWTERDGNRALLTLSVGDAIEGPDDARYRIGGRLDVEFKGAHHLALDAPDRWRLNAGVATFHVEHRESAPLRVRAGRVEVLDVGTTFTVDAGSAAPPKSSRTVLVTVAEGAVDANGVRVAAGHGLGFTGATPGGAPWRLDAKPAAALERGDAPARAGKPVEVRLVLSNPTDRWMALAAPDPLGAPLFIDVTVIDGSGAAGAVTPVRVTPSMGVDFDRLKAGIPPRGRVAVGVRFDTTFASKGTYRLRAVVQPAGTTDQPRSDELVLEVR